MNEPTEPVKPAAAPGDKVWMIDGVVCWECELVAVAPWKSGEHGGVNYIGRRESCLPGGAFVYDQEVFHSEIAANQALERRLSDSLRTVRWMIQKLKKDAKAAPKG